MVRTVAAAELLDWRREQLQAGGEASALDWLLDLEGGIPWQTLQQLRLHPEQSVRLAAPLSRLEQLWLDHLNSSTPLQYLVGRCPWRDLELTVQPGALIPRQETELLIDLAVALVAPPRAEALCVGLIWAPDQVAWPWPWQEPGLRARDGPWINQRMPLP